MQAILFGATGMVGQSVLRECLLDPAVARVLAVGRTPTGRRDAKLRELARADLWSYADIESELTGFDACFFCLGVSAAGMKEADYARITVDIAVAAATTLCRLNPRMTFVFVSGAGADSSGKGRLMWARVKGRAENALLALPFRSVYVFRPGIIEPLYGARSKTAAYRVGYQIARPLLPLLRRAFPGSVITSEQLARAMLRAARAGAPRRILDNRAIQALADAPATPSPLTAQPD